MHQELKKKEKASKKKRGLHVAESLVSLGFIRFGVGIARDIQARTQDAFSPSGGTNVLKKKMKHISGSILQWRHT